MDIEELRKSSEKVGQIYPVLKDKHGNIIDGFHRKAADINWKEVTLEWVDTEGKRLTVTLAANWMRRNIKRDEITRIITSLCEIYKDEWEGHYSREIAKITGFNIDTVEKYLPPEYKQKKETRIPPLDFSKGKEYIKRMLLKYGRYAWLRPKEGIKVPMPSELKREFVRYHDNVWEADPERPKRYGNAGFPGNTSPNVARDMLLRYTKEGDLVLDNMAGSGTIQDMCKELNRQCISYDIAPIRPDVRKDDARSLPLEDSSVDFIFSHFPYGDMHRYSYNKGDLSGMSPQEFLDESRKVMAEAHRILKPNHYYAVLIGDQRQGKEIIDWSAKFSIMGKELFKLHDKIIWYAKAQSAYRLGDKYDLIAAEHNFCKQTFDTLLIFKK